VNPFWWLANADLRREVAVGSGALAAEAYGGAGPVRWSGRRAQCHELLLARRKLLRLRTREMVGETRGDAHLQGMEPVGGGAAGMMHARVCRDPADAREWRRQRAWKGGGDRCFIPERTRRGGVSMPRGGQAGVAIERGEVHKVVVGRGLKGVIWLRRARAGLRPWRSGG
jgi:hypothetical protein